MGTPERRVRDSTDPFHTIVLNDIFKPVLAADRLKVLRRENCQMEIYLFEKDIKCLSKDRKTQLLNQVPPEEKEAPVRTSSSQ